jgi:hypothetical protein
MPGRIIDLSSNNHPGGAGIAWPLVKSSGVTTAIIKANEGTGYTNPYYAGDIADAQAVGIDVLAYHFVGTGTAIDQADFFKSVAGKLARVLDVETAQDVAWDRIFLQTLGWNYDQCMTYGSVSSLVNFYQQIPSMAWPAAYGQGYPGWGALWQFTDAATIPGISGPVDENRWYGSQIQYETLFGLLEPPPPVISGGDTNMLAPTPSGKGFWRCNALGAITTYGDAQYLGGPNTSKVNGQWGGPPDLPAGQTCVSIASHPGTQGYWIESSAGSIYAYGDAPYLNPNR